MSTFMAKANQVPQRWFVIDAADQVVGRLAVQIANILRGKHRPEYTPHLDTGEFVVIINASKLRFTGNKLATKDIPLVHPLSRRTQDGDGARLDGHASRPHPGVGGAAHGAAQQARPSANDQAQDLRRAGTSAPGATTARIQTHALTEGRQRTWPKRKPSPLRNIWAPDGARPPWPVCV